MQLGAVVTLGVDEDTTHVVAAAKNTDKVHWAAAHNRHIVSPAWLHACGQHLLVPVCNWPAGRGTGIDYLANDNEGQSRRRAGSLTHNRMLKS